MGSTEAVGSLGSSAAVGALGKSTEKAVGSLGGSKPTINIGPTYVTKKDKKKSKKNSDGD